MVTRIMRMNTPASRRALHPAVSILGETTRKRGEEGNWILSIRLFYNECNMRKRQPKPFVILISARLFHPWTDGSTHRAETLSLPSATWTPPALRHFGFPSELKDFLEVYVIRLISPWTEKAVNVVREDFQQFPENWKNIPHGRFVRLCGNVR